jgi:hypothetical protein
MLGWRMDELNALFQPMRLVSYRYSIPPILVEPVVAVAIAPRRVVVTRPHKGKRPHLATLGIELLCHCGGGPYGQ